MYEIYCKLRDAEGLKDADVVRGTGITKSTFSSWKNGKYTPKDEKLRKIAEYFGVSVEYLKTGKEPITPGEQGALLAEFAFKHMNMMEEFMSLSDDEQNGVKEIIHLFYLKTVSSTQ